MKKSRMRFVAVLLVICFFTAGCASIVSKSQYPVTIASNPDQAIITVTDDHGLQVYKGTTPTILTLRAGKSYFHGCSYTVHFEKEGYEPQTATIEKQLDAWFVGNLLFGGLIGILIVDPITGAMWKLNPQLTVNLAEETTSPENNDMNMQIFLLDDIPEHLRAKMIRVK